MVLSPVSWASCRMHSVAKFLIVEPIGINSIDFLPKSFGLFSAVFCVNILREELKFVFLYLFFSAKPFKWLDFTPRNCKKPRKAPKKITTEGYVSFCFRVFRQKESVVEIFFDFFFSCTLWLYDKEVHKLSESCEIVVVYWLLTLSYVPYWVANRFPTAEIFRKMHVFGLSTLNSNITYLRNR